MRKMSLLSWVLVVPAAVLLLFSLGLVFLVLSFMPPLVSAVAWVVVGVLGVWFFLVRGRGSGPVSEAGFIGQRSSKDGLL